MGDWLSYHSPRFSMSLLSLRLCIKVNCCFECSAGQPMRSAGSGVYGPLWLRRRLLYFITQSGQQLASHCRGALETYWAASMTAGPTVTKVHMRAHVQCTCCGSC